MTKHRTADIKERLIKVEKIHDLLKQLCDELDKLHMDRDVLEKQDVDSTNVSKPVCNSHNPMNCMVSQIFKLFIAHMQEHNQDFDNRGASANS